MKVKSLLLVCLLFALTACGETDAGPNPSEPVIPSEPGPSTEAPAISSFTASSETAEVGQEVTLNWELSGGEASFVTLDNGVGVVTGDSAAVAPEETTTYTLTVVNQSGRDTKTQKVTVAPADGSPSDPAPDPAPDPSPEPPGETSTPVIESFTASLEEIEEGESILLSWTLDSDDGVTLTLFNDIDNDEVDLTGETSLEISPIETTVYLLSAERGDEADTEIVTVEVTPAGRPDPTDPEPTDPEPAEAPVIDLFTASPEEIEVGQESELAWELSGGEATLVTIDEGVGEVSESSRTVSPTETTTYTLSATNEGGTDTAEVTLSVTGAVTTPPEENVLEAADLEITEEGPYISIDVFEDATYPSEGYTFPEVAISSPPAQGEVQVDGTDMTYLPGDFVGTVTFDYSLSVTNQTTGDVLTDSGTVTVNVQEE